MRKLYVVLFFLFGLLVSSHIIKAQTTLATGDISMVGFNSNAPDGFAFVTWVNLAPNTVIKFTDNGFNSASNSNTTNNYREQEQYTVWTNNTGSIIAAGTIITIKANSATAPTASVTNIGTITSVTNSSNGTTATNISLTNTSGDQIFAFQGTGGPSTNSSTGTFSGTLLFGLGYSGSAVISTSWVTTGSINGSKSYLPSDLSGNSQIFLGPNIVAGQYTGATTGQASLAAYKALVANPANWSTVGTSGTVTFSASTGITFTVATAPSITGQPSGSTICAGSNTSFTVTASNATGYLWQVNTGSGFSNISNGGVYTNATTATLNITGATAGMNGYAYRCIVSGAVAPNITSTGVTLTISSPGTWLGATSSAWSNAANWSCGTLPTASTDVTIPSGTTYSPTVDITTATCNNLTVNGGASITISSGNILDFKGSVTNNGTITPSGKTIFSGTGQTIPGLIYTDLEIAGTGAAKPLGGSVTVTGVLTLTNTLIHLNNFDLTIGNDGSISGGSSTCYFIANSTGTLKINNIGTGGRTTSVSFPIGVSNSSYTPISLTNTGTPDQFSARILDGVNASYDASNVPSGIGQTDFNVNKTWIVSEATPGGSNVTLTFQWNGVDEQSGFNRLSCFGSHYYSSSWHPGATGSSSGSDPYTRSLSNITSFSPFGIGSIGSVLPLTLLSFTGEAGTTGNVLSWTTTNETNVASFEIEKGSDGIRYISIGSITAKANGVAGQHTYQLTDASAGQAFYRLKMIDKDGSYNYSPVVTISQEDQNNSSYTIFPNPVTSSILYLKPAFTATDRVMVSVLDVTGKKWFTTKIEAIALKSGNASINVSTLPAGMYILQIRNEKTGVVSLLKFKK